MSAWEMWKKGFDSWESKTANLLETVVRSPILLAPSGAVLTAVMKAKTSADKAKATVWGALGLPTKRDQERVLHALNSLESRLLDLEERLEDSADERRRLPSSTPASGTDHAQN